MNMDNIRIVSGADDFDVFAEDGSIVFRFGDFEVIANSYVGEKIIEKINEKVPAVRPVSNRFNHLFCDLCGDCISSSFEYVAIPPTVIVDDPGSHYSSWLANETKYYHKMCWEEYSVS